MSLLLQLTVPLLSHKRRTDDSSSSSMVSCSLFINSLQLCLFHTSSITWMCYCSTLTSPPALHSMFRRVKAARSDSSTHDWLRLCVRGCSERCDGFLCVCLSPASSPCVLLPLRSAVIFYIPGFIAANKGHWSVLTACSVSVSLFFPQTYQQSASLQTKNRKKNKGKQGWHQVGLGRSCSQKSNMFSENQPFLHRNRFIVDYNSLLRSSAGKCIKLFESGLLVLHISVQRS